jgi:hypothetical protein
MMLIAAAVVLTRGGRQTRRRSLPAIMRVLVLCLGGYYFVEAAALEGVLGEGAQQRTLEQINRSGSLLVGGRPELAATVALLLARPLGFGAGALATPTDVLTAKEGMSLVGYDPNNGYVERYMFGHGFEVHSFLGDLWILFGPVGGLLALLVVAAVSWGMVLGLARGTIAGVVVFLSIRTIWDFAFSPFSSVMITVMLALAVALPRRDGSPGEAATFPGVRLPETPVVGSARKLPAAVPRDEDPARRDLEEQHPDHRAEDRADRS